MEKIAELVATLFEKATEMRFFLNFLCIAVFLELASFVFTNKSILQIKWDDIERIEFGPSILAGLGYFFLMGYALRFVYTLFSWGLFWLNTQTSWSKVSRHEISGMVHEKDILQRVYKSKDYEPLRALEAHKNMCLESRKGTRELAYLIFSSASLISISFFYAPGNFIDLSWLWLIAAIGKGWATGLIFLLILPLLMFIWVDAIDDFSRDEYLPHEPIYLEIKEESRKNREIKYDQIPPPPTRSNPIPSRDSAHYPSRPGSE
jgi:hypothetical protein